MLQHGELVVVSVTDIDPQPLPVKVPSAVGVASPVAIVDTVRAVLDDGVTVPTRVARAVAEPDPETVAVFGARTEFVPVFELVVVFDTLMLRVSVGEPVELRD